MQVDLNTTATPQNGYKEYALISMFTTTSTQNDHNIALYFTISSEEKIFNYYLTPDGDRITLKEVNVTGLPDKAIDDMCIKFLNFTNQYVNPG